MARRTKDHPLEYATFEGVIPEGRHGPDGVIVWDHGPGAHHRLLESGHRSVDVTHAFFTHLHYDHVGGFDQFPQARFHVQDREVAFATGRHSSLEIFTIFSICWTEVARSPRRP